MAEQKTANLQPKMLRGYVRAERIRCGRSNCKCAKGSLHGPYFYHFTWSGGKRRRRYVKVSDAKAVRAACENYKNTRRERIRARRQWRELMSSLRGLLHEGN